MKLSNLFKGAAFAAMTLVASHAFAIQKGFPVPDFSLKALSNAPTGSSQINLKDYKGKVVYIDFWASWCVPCRISIPELKALHAKYKSKGFEIIAINIDENVADAEKFLKQFPMSYAVASDPQSKTPAAYEVKGMPYAFLIDRTGKLIYVHEGYKKGDSAKIEKHLAEVL